MASYIMEEPADTSENNMSFELTGPAIVVAPFIDNSLNPSVKRSFTAFSNDTTFQPAEQNDRLFLNGNITEHIPTGGRYGLGQQHEPTLPNWIRWGIFRSLEAVQFTSEFLQAVYAATVTATMPVAATKRRLVALTQDLPAAATLRYMLSSRHLQSRLFRQNASTSPGHRSTTPITPPRFRPAPSSPFHVDVPGTYPVSPPKSPVQVCLQPSPSQNEIALETDASPPPAPNSPAHGLNAVSSDLVEDGSANEKVSEENTMLSDYEEMDDSMTQKDGSLPPLKYTPPVLNPNQTVAIFELRAIQTSYDTDSSMPSASRPVVPTAATPAMEPSTVKSESLDKSKETLPNVPVNQPAGPTELIESTRSSVPTTGQEVTEGKELIESTEVLLPNTQETSIESDGMVEPAHSPLQIVSQQPMKVSGLIESAQSTLQTVQEQPMETGGLIELTRSPFENVEERPLEDSGLIESMRSLSEVIQQQPPEANGLIESTRSPSETVQQQSLESLQYLPQTVQEQPMGLTEVNELTQSLASNSAQQVSASGSSFEPTLPALYVVEQQVSTFSGALTPEQMTPQTPEQQRSEHDGLIESTRSSSGSFEQRSPSVERSIDVTRSPPATPLRHQVLTPILKSSRLSQPRGGLLSQIISSLRLKRKQRPSPLREIFNDAKKMPKTPINKNARFLDNPVTRTRKYVKGEAISYPSPHSSREGNSLLSQTSSLSSLSSFDYMQLSPTQHEQKAMIANQLMGSGSEIFTRSFGPGSVESFVTTGSSPSVEYAGAGSFHAHPAVTYEDTASSYSSPAAGYEDNSSFHLEPLDAQEPSSMIECEDLGSTLLDHDKGSLSSPSIKSEDSELSGSGTDDENPSSGSSPGKNGTRLTMSEDLAPQTPPQKLSQPLENLYISGRRSSSRTRDKEKRRLEEEAIAAVERARKEKAEAEEKARKQKAEAEAKARKEKAEAEERARKEKEEAEEKARKEAEEEKKRKERKLQMPIGKVITPISDEWVNKVSAALALAPGRTIGHTSRGNPITRRDIGKVLPQRGSGDSASGWLNDVIIDAYLQAVVDHGNEAAGLKRGETVKFHAFSNFFYNNLREGGVEKVRRWAKRAKIGGKDLLNVEWVFIPVNQHESHWTLIAVSPTRRTIEYYDSFHGSVTNEFQNIKAWLRSELGSDYIDAEWKIVEDPNLHGKGKGPLQHNGSDCGMFTVTTAKMISLGVNPMAYSASDMPTQRRRVVAELIHGGFTDEFKPNIQFR